MRSPGPLLIIDSNYLCYQAFFAIKNQLSYQDMDTEIMFGFLSRILSLGKSFKTNRMIFCWDSKQSHRKKIFPQYKEHRRDRTPEEDRKMRKAFLQFKILRLYVLPRMGFRNIFLQPGLESDDLMARFCIDCLEEVVLITADEDLYQCLYPAVRIYNPSKHQMMTLKRFQELYKISPGGWALVKAIGGCKSDGVPGVKGVGEKTAIKYLTNNLKEESAAYKNIKKEVLLIEKNKELVTLPHPKTKSLHLQNDSFSMEGFHEVCDRFGFMSFQTKSNTRDWGLFFAGDFSGRSLIKKKRRLKA